MIGQTISHYKILEKLGEGGMGIVYKAQDTKLKRTVAIKFLPRPLSAQAEERERFTLEAQAASSLNHPNVATIYEIDEADGESFIVMEYVDGQTLGEVKAKLTVKQMVEIGIQVAEGIAAAHEKGIIHRDVKADNIMLRKDARVQVMDFGLAKLRGMSRLTKAGSTVGTIAYMSPEQVQGLEADHRTDIFSLGVVLYELLTGHLPFKGDHEAALMYEILNVEPSPPSSIQIGIDTDLDRIVMKCLEKDREERYQSVKDVAVDLRHYKRDSEGKRISRAAAVKAAERSEGRVEEGMQHGVPSPSRERAVPKGSLREMRVKIGIAASALILIAVLAIFLLRQEIAPPLITSTHPLTNVPGLEVNPSWSPDGTRIAYMSDESGNFDIYVQQVAAGQKLNITKEHTGNERDPSWSPDGEWIAYISDRDEGGIFVSPALGGTPRRVYTAPSAMEIPSSVNWSPDGLKLIFAVRAELFTIPSAGGKVEQLRLEQDRFAFLLSKPSWSIDGDRIVYAEVAGFGISTSKIWSVRVDGSDPVSVTDGTTFDRSPIWSRDGTHLFFVSDRGGSPDIWWVPVTSRGEPRAPARALTVGAGVESIALSADGNKLVYSKVVDRANIWVFPFVQGRMLTLKDAVQITSENFVIETLNASPDGTLIAFDSNRRGNADIYVMKTDGSGLRQITTDKAHDWAATWSPDGKRIAFHSLSTGNREIFTVPVEGGPVTQLTNHPAKDWAPRWSPTGKEIAFGSDRMGTMEIWIVPAEGGEARQVTRSGSQYTGIWSPDGKYIAFTSLKSGEFNLFVVPREGGEPRQVTRGGWFGLIPQHWSKDGKTIYVLGARGTSSSPRNIWAVSVADGKVWQVTDFSETSKRLDDFTTDGKQIFALFSESVGDIWLAELGKEK